MQGRLLEFCKHAGYEHSAEVCDLWRLPEHDVPQRPGAYVLVSTRKKFVYPAGTSRVFYIGCSNNLRERLKTHRQHTLDVRNSERHGLALYFPRYEYGAVFGARYTYITGRNPKALEAKLMTSFARIHRAFPIANSAGSWRRLNS